VLPLCNPDDLALLVLLDKRGRRASPESALIGVPAQQGLSTGRAVSNVGGQRFDLHVLGTRRGVFGAEEVPEVIEGHSKRFGDRGAPGSGQDLPEEMNDAPLLVDVAGGVCEQASDSTLKADS